MANTILIRNSTTTSPGETTLAQGELAYSYGAIDNATNAGTDRLYVGGGGGSGITEIGGKFYTDAVNTLIQGTLLGGGSGELGKVLALDSNGNLDFGDGYASFTGGTGNAGAIEELVKIGYQGGGATVGANYGVKLTNGAVFTGNLVGNADTATNLSTNRNFAITGEVSGQVSSNLSAGASIAVTVSSNVIDNDNIKADAGIEISKLAGADTTYNAKDGLTGAGAAALNGAGVDVAVDLDTAVSGGLAFTDTTGGAGNGKLGIKSGGVTAAHIATNAVGASEIQTNAVGTLEIANDGVETLNIKDDNVTNAKIADNAIQAAQIDTDAVTADAIIANAVGTAEIATNAVTANELANNAVDTAAILSGAVVGSGTGGAGVGSIAAGTLYDDDINPNAGIATTKLSDNEFKIAVGGNTATAELGSAITLAGTANEVDVVANATTVTIGLPNDVTITGDLTVSGTTTTVDSTTVTVADKMIQLASDVDTVIDSNTGLNANDETQAVIDAQFDGAGISLGKSTPLLTVAVSAAGGALTAGVWYTIKTVGTVSNWAALDAAGAAANVGDEFRATTTVPVGAGGEVTTLSGAGQTSPYHSFVWDDSANAWSTGASDGLQSGSGSIALGADNATLSVAASTLTFGAGITTLDGGGTKVIKDFVMTGVTIDAGQI